MRIAFYIEDPAFAWMARGMVASAKKHMPWAKVVQLSPSNEIRIEGVDMGVVTTAHPPLTFIGRYMAAPLALPSPYDETLYVNADVLFRGDVGHVFRKNDRFVTALPHIKDDVFRFDGGVIFTRSPVYYASFMAHEPCIFDPTATVTQQLSAINNVALMVGADSVPGARYSYVPRHEGDDGGEAGALVVHYRGPRKAAMARHMGIAYDDAWRGNREETHPGLGRK